MKSNSLKEQTDILSKSNLVIIKSKNISNLEYLRYCQNFLFGRYVDTRFLRRNNIHTVRSSLQLLANIAQGAAACLARCESNIYVKEKTENSSFNCKKVAHIHTKSISHTRKLKNTNKNNSIHTTLTQNARWKLPRCQGKQVRGNRKTTK